MDLENDPGASAWSPAWYQRKKLETLSDGPQLEGLGYWEHEHEKDYVTPHTFS